MDHAISKLPDEILNMKMSDFIINCGKSDFNDRYNVRIELHDPTNELGLDDSESEDEAEIEQSREDVVQGDQVMEDQE